MTHVKDNVKPSAVVYTDESRVYTKSLPLHGFEHHRINHSAEIYVSGKIHAQTIAGFWSQVERGIIGVHHAVSPKYLQSYVDEYVWRFNHRFDKAPMFFTMLSRASRPD